MNKVEQKLKSNIEVVHNLLIADTETNLTANRAWISIFVIFSFTGLTLYMAQRTRRESKIALETFYRDMSHYKDHECLKTRTLHVKGVLPDDRTGNGIEQYLNKILQ